MAGHQTVLACFFFFKEPTFFVARTQFGQSPFKPAETIKPGFVEGKGNWM
jgi:hypothetical protein